MRLRVVPFGVAIRLMSVVISFIILLSLCRAQNILTLERCIVFALGNSPQLRMADNALRSAQLSLSELKTAGLPQLKAVGAASYMPIPPSFGYDPAISNGGQLTGQVILQQSLYDAGMRGLKSDQLETDQERLEKECRLARYEVIFAVKQAFVEALRAQEEVELQQESVRQLEVYHDLIQRLHSGGGASYTDLLKTEIQTDGARIALARALESMVSARFSLGELMGVPMDTAGNLGGSLAELGASLPDSLFTAVGPDIARNLEMNIAGLQIERSLVEHTLASHERLPEISLVADAGYLSSGENLRLPSGERLNALGYSIGIGIELPILNWGATGIRMQQRELATDDLRQKMELLRRSLTVDLRKARLQLLKSRDRLRTIQSTVAKAEENYLLTKSKYAAGGTLSLEVLSAQQLLTDAKMAELQTLADIQVVAARIERLSIQ